MYQSGWPLVCCSNNHPHDSSGQNHEGLLLTDITWSDQAAVLVALSQRPRMAKQRPSNCRPLCHREQRTLSLPSSVQCSVPEMVRIISAVYSLTKTSHVAPPYQLGAQKCNSPPPPKPGIADCFGEQHQCSSHIQSQYLETDFTSFLRKSFWIFFSLPLGFSFISLLEDFKR